MYFLVLLESCGLREGNAVPFPDLLSLISLVEKSCSDPGLALCELRQVVWHFLTYRMSLLKWF